MSGYIDSDGSALMGALNPSQIGQALQVDASGNLKVSMTAAASAGSDGQTPGSVPLSEVGLFNGSGIDRLQGLNGAASVQDWVRQLSMQSKGFLGTNGLVNQAAGTYPLSIFNPAASGKSVLLYAIRCSCGSGSMVLQMQSVTSNPAFASAAVVSNARLGGASSAIAAQCTYATTSQSVTGTTLAVEAGPQNSPVELLSNGAALLLPAGSANGIVLYMTTFASGYILMNARWTEF